MVVVLCREEVDVLSGKRTVVLCSQNRARTDMERRDCLTCELESRKPVAQSRSSEWEAGSFVLLKQVFKTDGTELLRGQKVSRAEPGSLVKARPAQAPPPHEVAAGLSLITFFRYQAFISSQFTCIFATTMKIQ